MFNDDIIESLRPLPYAREVQAWLLDFLSAATQKKKAPEGYIRDINRPSSIFIDASDINQALDFISVIYNEHGYMPPWDLEDHLIQAFNPKLPSEAMRTAAEFSSSEKMRDPLTNYYQKPHTPLVMGLSALYAQSQNQPVSVIELDFSNMRGTNEHNEKVLKTAYPDIELREVRDIAMELTDQYAFLVAGTILKSIEDRINQSRAQPISLIPLRTGGDEVRVVAVNMTQEESLRLLPAIHDGIEATTATLGLHDHPHTKRPLDNFSNGFGAAGAVFPLKADGQFEAAIAAADKEIGHHKIILGRQRVENNPFAALKPENFNLAQIYNTPKAASDYLDSLHNSIIKIRQELNIDTVPVAEMQTIENIVHTKRPDHIPDRDELQDMIFESFREKVAEQGVQLTADQEKVLRIKVLKFPQNDPSSGALIGRDFPAMAGMALQVIKDINEKRGIDESLWTLGISFHNLAGLNETLGHGHSNLVLRYQAEIIQESLYKTGISKKNFQLAHMGNGDFHTVIQPTIIDDEGHHRTLTDHDMKQLSLEIQKRIAKLNDTPIKTFMQRYGVNVTYDPTFTFSSLENPRDPQTPGLRVSVSAKRYISDLLLDTHTHRQGGAVMRFIGDHLADMATDNKERWKREAIQHDNGSHAFSFPPQL